MEFIKELNKTVASVKNKESGAFLSISLGDLIYDILRVDPKVIEGIDFVRKESLTNAFKIGKQEIIDRSNKSLSSLDSLHSNYTGYTFERMVGLEYQQKGSEVVFPETANNPGYDVIINGQEFQIKCQAEGINLLTRHFEKYPNIPVIANQEAAIEFYSKFPEKEHLVINSGFTFNEASNLVKTSTDASVEIFEDENLYSTFLPEILGIVSIISIVKNLTYLSKGEITGSKALENISIESAGKFATAGIGAKIGSFLGPIGTVTFGFLGYMLGQSIINQMRIDSKCKKEIEAINKNLFNYLAATEKILQKNFKIFKEKINYLDKKLKKKSDIMSNVIKSDKYNNAKQFYEFFQDKVKKEEIKRRDILSIILSALKDEHLIKKHGEGLSSLQRYKWCVADYGISKQFPEQFNKYINSIIQFCYNAGVDHKFVIKEFNDLILSYKNFTKKIQSEGLSLS
jgi:hypothetical protein